MVIGKKQAFPHFVVTPELKGSLLAKGIGVSGGALSGKAVFSLDEIQWFRRHEPQTRLILIRFDTVPDDVREISAADGLLTSRGGATSHASIVAHHLGKTCVVGCHKLKVLDKEKRAVISNHSIASGDFLSIDGREGSVYYDKHPITEHEIPA
jgi:pyruvate,orthophosphate dikinase